MCNRCKRNSCGGGCNSTRSVVTVNTGTAGIDGKSAYQIAVQNGFNGTEQEWLDSLKGEGIPSGGQQGQVLAKASDDDGEVEWVDQTGGGTNLTFENGINEEGGVVGLKGGTSWIALVNEMIQLFSQGTNGSIDIDFSAQDFGVNGFNNHINNTVTNNGIGVTSYRAVSWLIQNEANILNSIFGILGANAARRTISFGSTEDTRITIEDNLYNQIKKGAYYAEDYAPNWEEDEDDLVLVHKKYVDDLFAMAVGGDFVDRVTDQTIDGFKSFQKSIAKLIYGLLSSELTSLVTVDGGGAGINEISGAIEFHTRRSNQTGNTGRTVLYADHLSGLNNKVSIPDQTGKLLVHDDEDYQFADNAAALAAGRPLRSVYRTGDILKIVHA